MRDPLPNLLHALHWVTDEGKNRHPVAWVKRHVRKVAGDYGLHLRKVERDQQDISNENEVGAKLLEEFGAAMERVDRNLILCQPSDDDRLNARALDAGYPASSRLCLFDGVATLHEMIERRECY